MKYVVTIIAMALLAAPSATAKSFIPGVLHLHTTDIAIRFGDVPPEGVSTGDQTVWLKQVWTRIGNKVIGNEPLICTFLGKGGAFGSGIADCRGTFNLPLGKIRVSGQRRNQVRYVLAVTGGTGKYQKVRGEMISQRESFGRDKVSIFIKR